LADRRLTHAELHGGTGEAQMTSDGLECAQPVQLQVFKGWHEGLA
jgi:hypothetical protein